MLMLQSIGKISGSQLRRLAAVVKVNFSSNQDKPRNPQNPLDLPEKQPYYEHKVNYNFEQNKKYTKDLKEVIAEKKVEEEIELKIKSNELKLVPRRQRRVYSTPRYDENISAYSAWRSFDREFPKLQQHSLPVVCKIPMAPKFFRMAFGEGKPAYRNLHATFEYDFEDANLDSFLIYDYRQTTQSWGANIAGYNYEDQSNITPRKRIQKWPTPEEFWESEEEVLFRVNASEHADFRKFRKFIISKVEEVRNTGMTSYRDRVIKAFGPIETFDDYNATYNLVTDPAIYKYNRAFYLQPGEKHETVTIYHTPLTPAKRLDDKHKIKKDEAAATPAKTA